jgi:hypothetical protein
MELLYDFVRLANALLASIVFGCLIYKGRLYFSSYDGQQKLLYIAFTLYVLAVSYGSVEAYALDIEGGFRLIPFLIANIIAIYAFARYRNSAFAPIED